MVSAAGTPRRWKGINSKVVLLMYENIERHFGTVVMAGPELVGGTCPSGTASPDVIPSLGSLRALVNFAYYLLTQVSRLAGFET